MKRKDGSVNMIPTFLGWRLWSVLLLVEVDFLGRPLKVLGVGINNGSNCKGGVRECLIRVRLCLEVGLIACVNIISP